MASSTLALWIAALVLSADATTPGPVPAEEPPVAIQRQVSRQDGVVVACSWFVDHGAMFDFRVANQSDARLLVGPDMFRVQAVLLRPDGSEQFDRLVLSSRLTLVSPDAAADAAFGGPSPYTRAQGKGSWNHVERKPGGSVTVEPTDPAGVYRPASRARALPAIDQSLRLHRDRLEPGETGGGLLQWNLPRAEVVAYQVEARLETATLTFRFDVRREPEPGKEQP